MPLRINPDLNRTQLRKIHLPANQLLFTTYMRPRQKRTKRMQHRRLTTTRLDEILLSQILAYLLQICLIM